jgi:adenylate kinase family enzyme
MYHNRSRPDMQEGCKEKIDMAFLKWVWHYPKSKRPGMLEKLDVLAQNKQVIILNSSRKVEKYVDEMKR